MPAPLMRSRPQLVSFANALRLANLSSIPGQQVTGEPSPKQITTEK
jgi:hypothetical protein